MPSLDTYGDVTAYVCLDGREHRGPKAIWVQNEKKNLDSQSGWHLGLHRLWRTFTHVFRGQEESFIGVWKFLWSHEFWEFWALDGGRSSLQNRSEPLRAGGAASPQHGATQESSLPWWKCPICTVQLAPT